MQNYYMELEHEFLEFTQIVPMIDNHSHVYSPRLYGLFHHACTQIEALSKWICTEHKSLGSGENFYDNYNQINQWDLLTNFSISLEKNDEVIFPFKNKNATSTKGSKLQHPWWVAYNSSKHKYPEGMNHATLGNVLVSLGAAFVLHEIARKVSGSSDLDLLNPEYWAEAFSVLPVYDPTLMKTYRRANKLYSDFFVYQTEFMEDG